MQINKFRLSFVSGEWMVVSTEKDIVLEKSRGKNDFNVTILWGQKYENGQHNAWIDLNKVQYIVQVLN